MPAQKLKEMIQGIRSGKFYGAIIVRKDGTIIDGEHRWKALRSLGAKQVPCLIESDADEADSKIITIRMNRERGYLTPVETGNVLSELQKQIPVDVLSKKTGIPLNELSLLTNLKYDPKHDVEIVTDKAVAWAKIDAILNKICITLRDEKFELIFYVGRGGLIPARLLADRLGIDTLVTLDQEHLIKSFDKAIFIDDIYDTGKTCTRVRKMLSKINGEIRFVFLYHRKDAEIPNDSIMGMDTEGHEYVVFPWDRFEFKKSQKTNLK